MQKFSEPISNVGIDNCSTDVQSRLWRMLLFLLQKILDDDAHQKRISRTDIARTVCYVTTHESVRARASYVIYFWERLNESMWKQSCCCFCENVEYTSKTTNWTFDFLRKRDQGNYVYKFQKYSSSI